MPAGRPRLFDSAEDVQAIVDDYFANLKDGEIPAMSGLALALGMSTETLRRYGNQDEFCATVKRARQKVEYAWEQALIRGGSGPIFWLKNNAGWKDKSEVDNTNKNESIHTINYVIKND
jgi:hypothetical protein